MINYLDFDLEISGDGPEYTVRVVNSPAGEGRTTMRLPFSDLQLENVLLRLETALLRSGDARRKILSPEEAAVQEFGSTLFGSVFDGEVLGLYRASQLKADSEERGLRLKLRINPPKLAALPWEFLYDKQRAKYICFAASSPIVRYIDLANPPRPLNVTPPLRVLAMIADPMNLSRLDVTREMERIERAIKPLIAQSLLDLRWLQGQTWQDLQRAMRREVWHVFHFVGHGGYDNTRDEGLVAFADEQGLARFFSATQLSTMLSDHRLLRLVLLNACEGARGSQIDIFSSTAAT